MTAKKAAPIPRGAPKAVGTPVAKAVPKSTAAKAKEKTKATTAAPKKPPGGKPTPNRTGRLDDEEYEALLENMPEWEPPDEYAKIDCTPAEEEQSSG